MFTYLYKMKKRFAESCEYHSLLSDFFLKDIYAGIYTFSLKDMNVNTLENFSFSFFSILEFSNHVHLFIFLPFKKIRS